MIHTPTRTSTGASSPTARIAVANTPRVTAGATGPLTDAATCASTPVPTAAAAADQRPEPADGPGRTCRLGQCLDGPDPARATCRGEGRALRRPPGPRPRPPRRPDAGLDAERPGQQPPVLHAGGQVRRENKTGPDTCGRTDGGRRSTSPSRSSCAPVEGSLPSPAAVRSRAAADARTATAFPAITRTATNMPMPPSEPLMATSRMLASDESRNSARPRSLPVRTDTSSPTDRPTASATAATSAPGDTVTPRRSTVSARP